MLMRAYDQAATEMLKKIRRGIRYPHLITRKANQLYHTKLGFYDCNPKGVSVVDEEWDNLIIFDACRYDLFVEHADLPGETTQKISKGSSTYEFIAGNFRNRNLRDTIVLTGNSWYSRLDNRYDLGFFKIYHPGSDVPLSEKPRMIAKRAKEVAKTYPHKRLIIHFIPPHHPYVGPTAAEYFPDIEDQSIDFFIKFRYGEWGLSDDLLERAYLENLDRIIPLAADLIKDLNGRTVVTSDHGEMLGDQTGPIPVIDYGHTAGLYVSPLVEVPWHVYDAPRRTIQPGEPEEHTYDEEMIEETLKELGYR
jgi:hypothetical protein